MGLLAEEFEKLTSRQKRHTYALLLGNTLQSSDKIRPLEVFGVMRPHVLQDFLDVEFAKLI